MHYLRPQYHAPNSARIAHMDMQMIQMVHTRSHCFSRTVRAQNSAHDARSAGVAARRCTQKQCRASGCQKLHTSQNGEQKATSTRRVAIAAARRRWLRPAANAPPTCKERAQNAQTTAATTQTLTRTPQWQSVSPDAYKQVLLFSARAAGKANGGEASTLARLS